MKPTMQTLFYDIDGVGNCFEACVASIFEIDLKDVPNFHGKNWFIQFFEWLHKKGYTSYGTLYTEKVQNYHGGVDGFFIVAGRSPRGDHIKGGHAVVYKEGKLVHDPHPDGTGIKSIDYIMSIEKTQQDSSDFTGHTKICEPCPQTCGGDPITCPIVKRKNAKEKIDLPNSVAWTWKMSYCQKNCIPPAEVWAWDRAEKAFEKHCKSEEKNEQ